MARRVHLRAVSTLLGTVETEEMVFRDDVVPESSAVDLPDGVVLEATAERIRIRATRDVHDMASRDFARPAHAVRLESSWFGESPSYLGFSFAQFAMPVWSTPQRPFNWSPAANVASPPSVLPLLVASNDEVALLAPIDGFHEQIISVREHESRPEFWWGWHGDIDEVPAGHSIELGVFRGVTASDVLGQWRDALAPRFRQQRPREHPLLRQLSYWTDNGAAYWYRSEPGVPVGDAVALKVEELRENGVSIGSVEIDSWFYPHEELRAITDIGYLDEVPPTGMMRWEPRPDVFPDGLEPLRARVGDAGLVLHSRHISAASSYLSEGEWWIDFAAHPQDQTFFEQQFRDAASWGANCVEQDWMLLTWFGVRQLRERPGRAQAWLEALNAAAEQTDLALLLCMTTPADLCAASGLDRVVAVRTCDDYRYADDPARLWRWYLVVNRLAETLGLDVFKDCFFTEEDPGASGLDGDPHREVESVLAALSGGVVGIGDRLGRTDLDIVARLVDDDGELMVPERPIGIADSSLFDLPSDERVTWAEAGTGPWRYVLALHLADSEGDLDGEFSLGAEYLVYDWRAGTAAPTSSLHADLGRRDWAYFVCCPLEGEVGRRQARIGRVENYATIRRHGQVTKEPELWWSETQGLVIRRSMSA